MVFLATGNILNDSLLPFFHNQMFFPQKNQGNVAAHMIFLTWGKSFAWFAAIYPLHEKTQQNISEKHVVAIITLLEVETFEILYA